MKPDATRFIIAPDDPGADYLNEMDEVEVTKVFDGDGFLAKAWHPLRQRWVNHIPCRFAFIDAPEMQQPLGAESKTFLEGLIAKKTLKVDPIGKEWSGYLPIDGYKRLLCVGFLTETVAAGEVEYWKDGKCHTGFVKRARPVTRNIELEMIINGWAWVLQQYAFDREEEYFAAQENAREARRGIWGIDNPEPPWRFKRRKDRGRVSEDRQPNLFDT